MVRKILCLPIGYMGSDRTLRVFGWEGFRRQAVRRGRAGSWAICRVGGGGQRRHSICRGGGTLWGTGTRFWGYARIRVWDSWVRSWCLWLCDCLYLLLFLARGILSCPLGGVWRRAIRRGSPGLCSIAVRSLCRNRAFR